MELSHWITIGVFACLQVISLVGTVWSVRTDTKILTVRFDDMQTKMTEFAVALTKLTETSNRLNLMDERQLVQGKRLDEIQKKNDELMRIIMFRKNQSEKS